MYNIIWADDDTGIYDASYESLADTLDSKDVKIIATATNAEELEERIKENLNFVDAVIIDANFSVDGDDPEDEHDISGLQYCVHNLLKTYGKKGAKIPFALYTARKLDELKEWCKAGHELRYFEEHKLLFDKRRHTTGKVLDALIAEIELIKTPEFKIRSRYEKEFAAAEQIPDACDILINGLLFEYNDDSIAINAQDLFNPLRKIVEKIMDSLKEEKLIPPIPSTQANGFYKFLSGEHPIFKLEEKDLMPAPLVCSLKFFLDITQDGSHSNKELKLAVDKYVAENKNINLYRTVLYIAMDLLLWHKKTIEKDFEYETWSWNKPVIGEGEIQYEEERKFDRTFDHFYVGKYELQRFEKVEVGAYAYIIKSGPNKHPYRNDHTGVYLTDFVSIEDFYII